MAPPKERVTILGHVVYTTDSTPAPLAAMVLQCLPTKSQSSSRSKIPAIKLPAADENMPGAFGLRHEVSQNEFVTAVERLATGKS